MITAKILAFAGSARQDSVNKKISTTLENNNYDSSKASC